jgi:hypothetical protein
MIAIALATLAGSTVSAQGVPTRTQPPPKMTQEEATVANLARLEELLSIAMVRRDRAMFERTLAPKFVYTRNDQLILRDDFINQLLQGETIFDARVDSVEVQAYGNIGVVTGWRTIAGRNATGSFERRHRFTDTWMPRSGTWQMLAAHDFVAAPAAPPRH